MTPSFQSLSHLGLLAPQDCVAACVRRLVSDLPARSTPTSQIPLEGFMDPAWQCIPMRTLDSIHKAGRLARHCSTLRTILLAGQVA
jgi:hypothetical protein